MPLLLVRYGDGDHIDHSPLTQVYENSSSGSNRLVNDKETRFVVYNETMKIEGLRLDPLNAQSLSVGATVEALPVNGEAPTLAPGQRLIATVLEVNGRQALIDLQGMQATLLTALPGLKPGSELFVRVVQVAPKLLLQVAPEQTKSAVALPPLAVGQEVDAEVVEQLPGGVVLISIQGAVFEAEAPETLPLGKTFSARVEQLRPQVILHLLPGAEEEGDNDSVQRIQTEAARLLRVHIPHHAAAAESLTALTQELAALVEHPQETAPPSIAKLQGFIKALLPDHTPPTAARLAAFIRDGGLHYEAKLLHLMESNPRALSQVAEEDLKGLLLQALQDLESASLKQETDLRPGFLKMLNAEEAADPHTPVRDVAASLAHHLQHIESQQAVNLLAQTQGEPYQLQIPFYTAQGLTTAFLSIEPDGKSPGEQGQGEKKNGYNILFALDLEHFGQTRIDARIGEKSLWAAFYVDQSASIALLQQELPVFRKLLQSLGYEEVLLVAKPLGQLSLEKRRKFATLTVGIPPSVHLLDIKA